MKRYRNGALVIAAALLILMGWIYRPYRTANWNKVHPSFANIKFPVTEAKFFYWKDGGSIGVKISDADSRIAMACCPRPLGAYSENLDRLFVGDIHYTFDGAEELVAYPDTRLVVAELLRGRDDPRLHSDRAAAELSGRWRDWILMVWRRITLESEYLSYDVDEAIF